MSSHGGPALRPLLLVPIMAGMAMLALGRTTGGALLVALGIVRLHLVLAPAVDQGIDRTFARALHAFATAIGTVLIGASALITVLPAWGIAWLVGADPLGRDAAARWRPSPSGHLAAPGFSSGPRAPRVRTRRHRVVRVGAVLTLAGALVIVMVLRRDPAEVARAPVPAALAHQPDVGAMQADEGAAYAAMAPDPQLGWVLPQSAPGNFVAVEDGHRRTEVPDRGGPTVWIFGGSAAWGSGQRDDHTIAAELSRLAAADGHPLRVVNRGVFAYTAIQEAEAFARAVEDEGPPDLVVFYDGYNDTEVSMVGQLEGLPPGSEAIAPLPVLRRDRVLHRAEGGPATTTAERVAGVVATHTTAMDRARATAASHGVAMVQAWQPNAFTRDLTPGERRDLEAQGYGPELVKAHGLLHDEVRRALPDEVIDLSDALDGAPSVYLDPVHTSERGAALVAAALYREIRTLVPSLGG